MSNAAIRITSPSDLLASIPSMIGFHPTESLVVIPLTDNRVIFTARIDLDNATDPAHVRNVTNAAHDNKATRFVIAAITENTKRAATVLKQAHNTFDLPIILALYAPDTQPGTIWITDDGTNSGTIPDTRTTDVALASACDGRITAPSRDALAQLLTPAPTRHQDDSTRQLAAYAAQLAEQPNEYITSTMHRALDAMHPKQPISVELAQRIATMATIPEHRDTALALAALDADAATTLYARAARHSTGNARAAALILTAAAAYLAGNGALANIALDTAATETDNTPTSRLGELLAIAINGGIRPEKLLPTLTEPGIEQAQKLGIELH